MTFRFIVKKRGMTQAFTKEGHAVACTILEASPNVVVQIKKEATDGYNAIQLGGIEKSPKNVTKPLRNHFAKAKVNPCSVLLESRIENIDEYTLGQSIGIDYFSEGDYIDVSGVSKGKGFQGVMKLHGFSGGPASHGSGFHRHAGSTGMRSTPGRCFAGGKRASRMGSDKITVQSLQIFHIDPKKNLLVIKGAIPGSNGSNVVITKAIKKTK